MITILSAAIEGTSLSYILGIATPIASKEYEQIKHKDHYQYLRVCEVVEGIGSGDTSKFISLSMVGIWAGEGGRGFNVEGGNGVIVYRLGYICKIAKLNAAQILILI